MPRINSSPPTPTILAVLDHLAEARDLALVRLHSQWWVRDSDRPGALHRETHDIAGRMKYTGGASEHQPPLVVIPTGTVQAMARRGLLRFVGRKKRVIAGSVNRDHWRAELTPAGTALRESLEDRAERAYAALLRRLPRA